MSNITKIDDVEYLRVAHSLQAAAQLYCMELLQQAMRSQRTRKTAFLDIFKVPEDLREELWSCEAADIESVASDYASRLIRQGKGLEQAQLPLMIQSLRNRRRERKVLDDFLIAGASNPLMKKMFDIRSDEACARRRMLGIEKQKYRCKLPEDPDAVMGLWNDLADDFHNERDRYLELHHRTGLSLEAIHTCIMRMERGELHCAARRVQKPAKSNLRAIA